MKAGRRQELQTNELAQAIADAREFLNRYGNYVIGGVIIIAVIAVVFVYVRRTQATALTNAQDEVKSVQFYTPEGGPLAPDKVTEGLDALLRIADETTSPDLAQRALLKLGDGAMSVATIDPTRVNKDYLDRAEKAFNAILERFPNHDVVIGRVLCSLATLEANRFVLDHDLAHKEKARTYLERVRDDARFNGMPFKTIAIDEINRLNDVFQVIEFGPTTPPPERRQVPVERVPSPTTAPGGDPPAPQPAAEEIPSEPDPVSDPVSDPELAPEPAEPAESTPDPGE